jgi:hypothetical protein
MLMLMLMMLMMAKITAAVTINEQRQQNPPRARLAFGFRRFIFFSWQRLCRLLL